MQDVCRGRCQNNFRIAGYLNDSALACMVRERDTPQFDVIFRRNSNLRVGLKFSFTTTKLHLGFGEDGFVRFEGLRSWLMSSRPEPSGANVTDITKSSPWIARGVFTPSGYRHVFPSAVSSACIGNHHVILAIREQMHFRNGSVRSMKYAHRCFRSISNSMGFRKFLRR